MALEQWWRMLLSRRKRPDLKKWLWVLFGGLIGALAGWAAAELFSGPQGSIAFPVLRLLMITAGGASGGAVATALQEKRRELAMVYASLGGGLILAFGLLILLLRALLG